MIEKLLNLPEVLRKGPETVSNPNLSIIKPMPFLPRLAASPHHVV
jgi:hypothetical protein